MCAFAVLPSLVERTSNAATPNSGSISGAVSNAATENLLEGAKITIPSLGLTTLTDQSGFFILTGVPVGSHEVVASYTGLDSVDVRVQVAAGKRAHHDFDLTSAIYKLQEFRVVGEREGGAAAITAQRNAANVKNVVAMDSFGNLPNMSPGELAIRLPGVAGGLDLKDSVLGLTVRGMPPTLNRVTIDGGLIANSGGLNRSFQPNSLTGAMFEQMEVIKGHTPDKGADSLGGTINLVTRSPLSIKERRRVTYSVSARIAPSFTQQIPLREAHRAHPLVNLSYQEVFDFLGGHRNFGVAVNTFYSENIAGVFFTTRDYQNTTAQPAYLFDYQTADLYSNRKQASVNVKTEYRLSPTTRFTLNTIYNDSNEPLDRRYQTRAFTSQTVGTTGTAGILPGFTNRVTQVRATPGSAIEVTSSMFSFYNRLRQLELGGEHKLARLTLDYKANTSTSHANLAHGKGAGGTLVNRIDNVGWILDRTQSDLYPRFIQTEGAVITDPANYRPTASQALTTQNEDRDIDVKTGRFNAESKLPAAFPFFLKAGGEWREQVGKEVSRRRAWNYAGAAALPTDPTVLTWERRKTGRNLPQWNVSAFIKGEVPLTPSPWNEDRYFAEQVKFSGTREVTETVTAGYVMTRAKLGATGLLAGVRTERTEDDSWGWIAPINVATAAERLADPAGSARRNFANSYRERSGSYTKSFPSAHLNHDITRNLKARLSWSTSFGRPQMFNYLPGESANNSAQTLTLNNPNLQPQTAANWDATLEYYFEPAGSLSVGWFHKDLKDFLVSGLNVGRVPTGADNGYGGQFAGYEILTTLNAGAAVVQGWEFGYQQQFTFLPGFLKGLSLTANYSLMDTHGDFGANAQLTSGQVAGFVPRTGNLSLSYGYRAFSARLLANYTSSYINTFTATSLGRNLYMAARTIVNASVAYEVRPALRLTCDVSNLFNEPTAFYRGIPDQMQRTSLTGTTITLGVTGRF